MKCQIELIDYLKSLEQPKAEVGCERMFTAKSMILDAIMDGEDIEPCTEQCCIGCNKVCGYRCGQGIAQNKK